MYRDFNVRNQLGLNGSIHDTLYIKTSLYLYDTLQYMNEYLN